MLCPRDSAGPSLDMTVVLMCKNAKSAQTLTGVEVQSEPGVCLYGRDFIVKMFGLRHDLHRLSCRVLDMGVELLLLAIILAPVHGFSALY